MIKEDVEYQAFVWDKWREKYVPEGRSVGTESLCRARLQEKIDKDWLPSYLDGNRTMIMKRKVKISYGRWAKVTTEE